MMESITAFFAGAVGKTVLDVGKGLGKAGINPALDFAQKKTGGREGLEYKFALLFKSAAEDFEKEIEKKPEEEKPSYAKLFGSTRI